MTTSDERRLTGREIQGRPRSQSLYVTSFLRLPWVR